MLSMLQLKGGSLARPGPGPNKFDSIVASLNLDILGVFGCMDFEIL